jgi:hypothetical protein
MNARGHFSQILANHLQKAGEISGMTYKEARGGRYPAVTIERIAESVIGDYSVENMKRLCWTLYYSPMHTFTSIYGESMGPYYEDRVMKEMGVTYGEENNGSKDYGCVAFQCTKVINEERCKVVKRLRRRGINIWLETKDETLRSKKKEMFPKTRESHTVYLIATPANEEGGAPCRWVSLLSQKMDWF